MLLESCLLGAAIVYLRYTPRLVAKAHLGGAELALGLLANSKSDDQANRKRFSSWLAQHYPYNREVAFFEALLGGFFITLAASFFAPADNAIVIIAWQALLSFAYLDLRTTWLPLMPTMVVTALLLGSGSSGLDQALPSSLEAAASISVCLLMVMVLHLCLGRDRAVFGGGDIGMMLIGAALIGMAVLYAILIAVVIQIALAPLLAKCAGTPSSEGRGAAPFGPALAASVLIVSAVS